MAETPADERTLGGPDTDVHHVDIAEAEAAFTELSRALSRRSRTKSVSDDEKEKKDHTQDIEKAHADDVEQTFDLREYLTTSNDAMQSAGIQHKHVGVTWDNLRVDVLGGTDHKVNE